jgi:hypothetical protein
VSAFTYQGEDAGMTGFTTLRTAQKRVKKMLGETA